jgi:CRP/FNR family transcriptional regulator, polysaccharide utilization system transcription regulator
MKTITAPRCYTCRIRNCSMMKRCDDQALEVLSDLKQYFFYRRGECIIREGEENKGCFFIASGVVKMEINGRSGRPLILHLCGAGDHFGHRLSPDLNTNPYTVKAVEDTAACFLSPTDFNRMNQQHQSFQKEIIHSYIKELSLVESRSLHLAQKTVKQKVADALLKIASVYHYQHNASGIRVHLDRQDMADMAGTTKEQVSKFLIEFMEEGWVRFHAKHFKFIDVERLAKVVDVDGLMV